MPVQRPQYHGWTYTPRVTGAASRGIGPAIEGIVAEYRQKIERGEARSAILEELKLNTILADDQLLKENGYLSRDEAARDYARLEAIISREDLPIESAGRLAADFKKNQQRRAEEIKKAEKLKAYTGDTEALGRLRSGIQESTQSSAPGDEQSIVNILTNISERNERQRQEEMGTMAAQSGASARKGIQYELLPMERDDELVSAERPKAIFASYERLMKQNYGEEGLHEWEAQESVARTRIRAGEDPATVYREGLQRMDEWRRTRQTSVEKTQQQREKLAAEIEKAKINAKAKVDAARTRATANNDQYLLSAAVRLEAIIEDYSKAANDYQEVLMNPKGQLGKMLAQQYGMDDPILAAKRNMEAKLVEKQKLEALVDQLLRKAGLGGRPQQPTGDATPNPNNPLGFTPKQK